MIVAAPQLDHEIAACRLCAAEFAATATAHAPRPVVWFRPGAGVLIAANQVKTFFGMPIPRGSHFHEVIEYFFTHLQVIRPNVTLVASNSNAWPHYLLNLNEGDILVAFDIRRYENDLENLANMAKERKAQIILFTDQWGSPVSKLADHTFHARIEAPSAWDSTVVIMFIVEALISAIETRNWSRTHDRMRELEELFGRTRLFRKPC